MGYRTRSARRSLVVEWTGTPTLDDVRRLTSDVLAFAHRHEGAKIALWVLIPIDTTELPRSDVRGLFQQSMPAVFERCEFADVILVGNGVRATLMRTGIRTMAMLARTSAPTRVYESVDSAVRERALPPDVAAILRDG